MRSPLAVLTLLLAAPVLGAGALESPGVELAATPTPGADDTCAAALLPPEAPAVPQPPGPLPCADLPLFVDEGGDTMHGDLTFDTGFGPRLNGNLLRGSGATNLAFGSRSVCLATVATAGCVTGASSPLAVAGSTVGLGTAGCAAGEAWLWSGSVWSCDAMATQPELDAVQAALAAKDAQLNARLDTTDARVNQVSADLAATRTTVAQHTSQVAALQAKDQELAAALNTLTAQAAATNARVDQVGGRVEVVRAELMVELARHDHGILHNRSSIVLRGGFGSIPTAVTANAFPEFRVPDMCPGAGTHTYLVQAAGYATWAGGISGLPGRLTSSMVVSEKTITGGDTVVRNTHTQESALDTNDAIRNVPLAWNAVVEADEGDYLTIAHRLSKVHNAYEDMDYRGSLTLLHLGATCT